MKVLVIRLSALGDVAMALPVVYSVARSHPQAEFDVLTRPFFARLFIGRPGNVNIVEADYKGRHKGICGTARLLRELIGRHYDAVADLHNVGRSWTIDAALWLSGRKIAMVNKMRRGRKNVTKDHKAQPNFVNRYADVFRRLGLEAPLAFKSVFGDTVPEPPIPVKAGTIGIAPYARYRNKALPQPQLEALIASLTGHDHEVRLFGGRGDEAATLARIARRHDGCECVAGCFSIESELALMANLGAMISMDSANQHLASLAGTPVVTLWGSTTPLCGFAPYGQKATSAVCLGLDCQPCTIAGSDHCRLGTFRCLEQMPVDEAARLAIAAADERQGRSARQ